MRYLSVIGILLAAAGAFATFKGVSYKKEESVFKVGQFEAKVQERHEVPQWIGGVALGAGTVLFVLGLTRK
jgi:hypothetical protein